MSDECAETPLGDIVKAVIEFMAQGPRMVLSDAPGDSSMITMSSTGKVSIAVAAALAEKDAEIERLRAALAPCAAILAQQGLPEGREYLIGGAFRVTVGEALDKANAALS